MHQCMKSFVPFIWYFNKIKSLGTLRIRCNIDLNGVFITDLIMIEHNRVQGTQINIIF